MPLCEIDADHVLDELAERGERREAPRWKCG